MKSFRKLKQDWKWAVINVSGLSVAMACLLSIFLYTQQELSFDRFHSKADRIYRITTDSNNGATSIHPARVSGDWPQKLMNEYPAIEKIVRLVPFRKAIIKIGDQQFYSQQAFSTDSSFFTVFDFKVLSGNTAKAFVQPGRAFISRSLAMKYFGTLNVTGKEIFITHQQAQKPKVYTIDGVMEDFPVNSHFHAELLTSFTDEEEQTTWAYTYSLLKKGTDVEALRNTIQQKWEKENKAGSPVAILHLQKLTDIHLFSQKTREMEKNGDIRSVIMLVSGAFIVLFIALINYLNLSRVQFISQFKSVKMKLINGASRMTIAREMARESWMISTFSVLAGLLLAIRLSEPLHLSVFRSDRMADLVLIALGFIFVIAILTVFPLFTSKIVSDFKVKSTRYNLYTFPLVIQFTLAVVTMTGTLVLNRQMDFMNSLHPASQNANMLVIADNPWESIQRYETFKSELLKSPSITNVTAAMEEPGGDILDNVSFEMEGIPKKEGQSVNIFTIDPNFFTTIGAKPLAGTIELGNTPSQQWEADAVDLGTLRTGEKPDQVKINELEKKVGGYREKYILNQKALQLIGIQNPQDAVGKHFRLNFFLPDLFPEGEIVGVVPDFHYTNLHSEEKPLAIAPRKLFNSCFLISIDPKQRGTAMDVIHSSWEKINPDFPLEYKYVTDSYQKIYASEYAETHVLSLFTLISIILSTLGIFALSAFSMQRRIKEIGIRKVNGARIFEVITLLNKDFLKWVAIAFLIATPVAWYAMNKWLENFAYKTGLSWWIFALAGALALSIALLTVSFQSWKAATRNPVEALKYE